MLLCCGALCSELRGKQPSRCLECCVDTLLLAPLNVTTHSRLARRDGAGKPKSHFCKTFFYAKLAGDNGYKYKDVRQ